MLIKLVRGPLAEATSLRLAMAVPVALALAIIAVAVRRSTAHHAPSLSERDEFACIGRIS